MAYKSESGHGFGKVDTGDRVILKWNGVSWVKVWKGTYKAALDRIRFLRAEDAAKNSNSDATDFQLLKV